MAIATLGFTLFLALYGSYVSLAYRQCEIINVGSINSFREIFGFISSRLLSERRKQCEY